MAILILGLSVYKFNYLRIGLALIWVVITFSNWNVTVFEIQEEGILAQTGFLGNKRFYPFNEVVLKVQGNAILANGKRIYRHNFMFDKQDFTEVVAFLSSKYPDENLGRHLIEE